VYWKRSLLKEGKLDTRAWRKIMLRRQTLGDCYSEKRTSRWRAVWRSAVKRKRVRSSRHQREGGGARKERTVCRGGAKKDNLRIFEEGHKKGCCRGEGTLQISVQSWQVFKRQENCAQRYQKGVGTPLGGSSLGESAASQR